MGGGCNSRIESLQVFLTFDLYLDLDCDKNKAFSEFQKEFQIEREVQIGGSPHKYWHQTFLSQSQQEG